MRRPGCWALSFITEGAIPFAAADPLRVIPSLMVGSAVTGALSMAFGGTSRAPHGGIWVVGLIGKPALYLLAIAVGIVVGAVCVVAASRFRRPRHRDRGRAAVADGHADRPGSAPHVPSAG